MLDNFKIIKLDIVDSTNEYAKLLAKNDFNNTIIIAKEQTKGKGRQGKNFYSPNGSGLYFSILIKPNFSLEKTGLVTTATCVAVVRVLKKHFNKDFKIKWVNDILLDNKKICGILAEAQACYNTNQFKYLVIGIGINLSKSNFPDDIKFKATYINDKIINDKNSLAYEITDNLMKILENIDNTEFIDEYKENSIIINKQIQVIKPNLQYNAKCLDINNSGGLIIQKEDGTIEELNTGEISIRGDFY